MFSVCFFVVFFATCKAFLLLVRFCTARTKQRLTACPLLNRLERRQNDSTPQKKKSPKTPVKSPKEQKHDKNTLKKLKAVKKPFFPLIYILYYFIMFYII